MHVMKMQIACTDGGQVGHPGVAESPKPGSGALAMENDREWRGKEGVHVVLVEGAHLM